jgi:hypothetical protein
LRVLRAVGMLNRMVWTLLIALSPGVARAQDCGAPGLDVLAVSPEAGAEEVPRDARVVLQLRGAGDFHSLDADVVSVEGAPVDGRWTLEWSTAQTGLATFEPNGPFAPDARYRIELGEEPLAPSYDSNAWMAEFTTSGGLSEGASGRPTLSLGSVGQVVSGMADRCEPDVFRRVELLVDPADTERPSAEWVLLYEQTDDEDRLLATRRVDGRDWADPLEVLVPTDDDAFCVVAVHRDVAGGEVATAPACWEQPGIPDEDQVAYYGGGRCSTVGWGGAVWLVVLPWLVRRRR